MTKVIPLFGYSNGIAKFNAPKNYKSGSGVWKNIPRSPCIKFVAISNGVKKYFFGQNCIIVDIFKQTLA